jgi:hypothetical protein
MPVRINSKWRFDSFPTSSVNNSRSRVIIWEALATGSFGRPGGSNRTGTYYLEGLPNTHGLGRLPFDAFKGASCRR